MPDFTDVFTTPAAPASELLCWFLLEAWSPSSTPNPRRMYTAHRGSHFGFLHSTHRVWSFNLNEQYWQRWFHHFLGAAEHYRVLQEKARLAGGKPVLLIRPDPTALSKRVASKFPPEHPHVHPGAAMCPFARRMISASAENPHSAPVQPPTAAPAAPAVPAPVAVAAADAAPASSSPSSPSPACVFGVVTPEHIRVMQYYLHRLREWMDESDLAKFGNAAHRFDEAPAPVSAETSSVRDAPAVAVAPVTAVEDSKDPKPAADAHVPPVDDRESAANMSIHPSVASSSSEGGSSASSSPETGPLRPITVATSSPNTRFRLYVPPAAPGGFTAAQVAQHASNSEGQRAWTIIDGKIYNITRFAHPGGMRLLQTYAFGKDCSEAFHQAHPTLKMVHTKAMEQMYIGKLIEED